MANYWHLVLYDGEVVPVKPENVSYVQKCITRKEHINTPTRTVMIGNIKDFVPTDIPVIETKLIEATEGAARAFGEPMLNEDQSIICRAVKKSVPQRKWDTYYSVNPGYVRLAESGDGVTIGFVLPVHLIQDTTIDCTVAESAHVWKALRGA